MTILGDTMLYLTPRHGTPKDGMLLRVKSPNGSTNCEIEAGGNDARHEGGGALVNTRAKRPGCAI